MSEQKLLRQTPQFYDYEVVTEISAPVTGPNGVQQEKKKVFMKGILQKADTLNQNGRVYPMSVLEREVRNYQKFIVENRALGELDHPDSCVPTGTEIFTRDGWKKIEDISSDEVVCTINLTKNEIEFQRVNEVINEPYDGKMYTFKNARTYEMTVTPNHRVLMWDRSGTPVFMTAKEMHENALAKSSSLSHSSLRRAGATWRGEDVETVNIAGKTIDATLWAAFLGIYLAEGHSSGVYSESQKKLHHVVITQNRGETADKIGELLSKLPWDYEIVSTGATRLDFKISDAALHSELIGLGGSRQKRIPLYAKQWSPRLLDTLLQWMLLGDGRHRKGSGGELIPEYCTTSKQLADDVYDVMLKLGSGASVHIWEPVDTPAPDHKETGRMILAENKAPMNIVYQHASAGMSLDLRFMRADVSDYTGNIHCVVTPNGTWLMRQNGKVCWTGNSVVNLKNVSHIIREAYIQNGTVYGTAEILDTPSGKILQSLVESGVKLGISSRGVGSTKKQGDYYVVQEDFQLICWDYVSEPSTPGAFMIPEGKTITQKELKAVFNRSDRIDRILNDILK